MPSPRSFHQDSHDRKLALSFGAILLLLMLIASALTSYLFTQLSLKEENRLSATIATILGESISKVSFSGKYHARLFVEEMQALVPELAFIAIINKDGSILAHSQSIKDDTYLTAEENRTIRAMSLNQDRLISQDDIHDGKMFKEVVLPYRSGLNNEISGVIHIGIKIDEVRKEQRVTFLRVLIITAILTAISLLGVMFLSRYFGREHRLLAAQLQGLLDHAPILINIKNQSRHILAFSAQFERLFGRPSDNQTMDQFLAGQLPAADIRKLTEIDDAVFESGEQTEREMGVILHGSFHVWHVNKFPIDHDQHGKATLVCSFLHDITERKLAEEEVLKVKLQWESTFDAIEDIITIHDRDMRIIRANKAAADLFQTTPDQLIGRHCYELFRGSAVPCPNCPDITARSSLRPHQANICHEKLKTTFESAAFPILEEGVLVGSVHVAKDISKSLQLEHQLKQAQKMEAIGTLAGGIAHDFNNILTPIIGYAEMALNSVTPDNPLTAYLQQINIAANRAKDLVQQILAFSRQNVQEKIPILPHLLIKEALKLLRASLPTTIEFKTEIARDCGFILIDPTQFHQIIMNLCTNAFHAMEKRGGILGVRLSPLTIDPEDIKVASSELLPGDYIQLEVSDTGCGMSRELLDRIFEPYFTTKDRGKGTGMGLSTVHGIVKSCQGHIAVYSEPDKGSSFHVYLPRIAATPAINGNETKLASQPTGVEHILIVDDEKILCDMLQGGLKPLGYKITSINDSLEALALLERDASVYDLLITDMTMPQLTGIELARKAMTIRPGFPIILFSGFSALINKEQALALGIRAYMKKPFSVRELAMVVRQVLDQPPKEPPAHTAPE